MTVDNEPTTAPDLGRRQFVKGAAVLGGLGALAVAAGVVTWRSGDQGGGDPGGGSGGGGSGDGAAPAAQGPQSLDALADAVTSGGPGKDGIPAIDEPRFVPAGAADFLGDDEPVFGLDHRGEVRAYPQLVLVWHEIVNDTVDGRPLAVTYCPLTGTAIGFTGVPGGPELTFGTTGNLVNSNLLMYDRQTDSEWPQLLGVAIRGPQRAQRLGTVPLVWTTWRAWRDRHPDTQVLSTETGFLRRYGDDPYGSYPDRSGYYVDGEPMFDVLASDDRFAAKDVVIGVRVGDDALAVHRELVRREKSVPVTVAGTALTVVWDEALGTARVAGPGSGAAAADVLDAMWFAWYAFFPHTVVMR